MDYLVPILVTIIFGFLGVVSFYHSVQDYNSNDESYLGLLSYDFGPLAFISLLFEGLLWMCQKVLPENLYILVFRSVAFILGVIMLIFIIAVWSLYLPIQYK